MMLKVFMAILETFIVFGFGVYAWRRKMLMPEDLDKLSKLTLDFFFPMLTFSTIVRDYNPERINELWIMPLVGLGIMAFGGAAGLFFKRFMRQNSDERVRTFHHICAINNYVFLPLIVLQNIYGERHVALLLLMNVGSTVGFWTIGVLTLQGGGSLKQSLKSIWSINIFAVFAALAWAMLGIPMPVVLGKAIHSMGAMSVPFMLLLIGVALAQCWKAILAHKIDIVYLSITRLVLIPLLVVGALYFIPLPNKDIYDVVLVVALMPAASSTVLVARRYGGSTEFAGQAIIVTTLLSLLTIPLMMHFFGK